MTQEVSCLVDGRPADAVPVDDRGFQYGDGLFETCRVEEGRVACLTRHLARLSSGCERLGFPQPDLVALRAEIDSFVAATRQGVLKLTLTRGSSARGYGPAGDTRPRRVLCLSPLPDWPPQAQRDGVRLRFCDTRLVINPRLAGIKHLNRLEQVLARREWHDEAIRDGLMCDTRERVIEGTMSNLFLVTGGVLHTPRLDECGVAGVMRSVVIDLAEREGMVLEIGDISRHDVRYADELFVCNSLIGIWPVASIDGMNDYPVGDMTRALQDRLAAGETATHNWYPR